MEKDTFVDGMPVVKVKIERKREIKCDSTAFYVKPEPGGVETEAYGNVKSEKNGRECEIESDSATLNVKIEPGRFETEGYGNVKAEKIERESGIETDSKTFNVKPEPGGFETEAYGNVKSERIEPESEIESDLATCSVKIEPGQFETEAYVNVKTKRIKRESEIKSDPTTSHGKSEWTHVKTEKMEDSDSDSDEEKFEPETYRIRRRWLTALPFVSVVKYTSFVPFKMPFVGSATSPCPPEYRFDIFQLLKAVPNIGLIVDLTHNLRFYEVSDLTACGVEYVNIPLNLRHKIEALEESLKQFIDTSTTYTAKNHGKLIAVHDSFLGTGESAYMICKMLESMGMHIQEAIDEFEIARGYKTLSYVARLMGDVKRPSSQRALKKLRAKVKKAARESEQKVKMEPKFER